MGVARKRPRATRRWRVGIDTGGTFTDLAAVGPSETFAVKVPSTPQDPSRAVLRALEQLLEEHPRLRAEPLSIVHGSTVATNALLEKRLARVAFLTNEGFEDLIEIGRQARSDLYSLEPSRPDPLVGREDRCGVPERTGADGKRLRRPSARDLAALRSWIERRRPDSIAIGLLHSYANGAAERELERALRPLCIPMTRSSAVAPRFREYERFSTTVANAALLPLISRYLESLRVRLRGHDLMIEQSNGGLTSVADARQHPVRLVLSGPAGGVHGARHRLSLRDRRFAITFDMGGTSTDVCLLRGDAERTEQVDLAGRPLLVEALEIRSIGAGGGSILWQDQGGALRVGPQSAGADPGPACYGKGSVPCVTDAHVVLGRLPLSRKLGGSIVLDPRRSERALQLLAKRFRTSPLILAERVLEVTDAHMEQAIKKISLERGHDPRDAVLFSYGGAGGLHACRLCTRLGLREVLIPPLPGASCAYGMAVADARLDVARGLLVPIDSGSRALLQREIAALRARARRLLQRELGPGPIKLEARVACRYRGQSYELNVPFAHDLRRPFERLHQRRYGFVMPDQPLECVALQATAIRRGATPPHPPTPPRGRAPELTGMRRVPVWFADAAGLPRPRLVPVLERTRLVPGWRAAGPLIIEEDTATTVVEPGFELSVDERLHLRLRPRAARQRSSDRRKRPRSVSRDIS